MDLDGPMGENVVVILYVLCGLEIRVEICLEKSTKSSNESLLLLLNLIYNILFILVQ